MTAGRVRLLWTADFHDAPISGLAEVAGKEMWFDTPFDEVADDYAPPRDRVCFLYELTEEERQQIHRTHESFERWVSTTHCHHLDTADRVVRDRSRHHLFYDAGHPGMPDVRERPNAGSFRLYDVWTPRESGESHA